MKEEASDEELESKAEVDKLPLPSRSIFKVAIQNSKHSLAYLTLSEYDCTKAIQDVIESGQLNLVNKILDKIPKSQQLNIKNAKGQNLLHIFVTCNHCQMDDQALRHFFESLIARNVNVVEVDSDGRTVLHYAC